MTLEDSREICTRLNHHYQQNMVRPINRTEVEKFVLPFLRDEMGFLDTTVWINGTDKPFQSRQTNSSLDELLRVDASTYQEVLHKLLVGLEIIVKLLLDSNTPDCNRDAC